MAVRLKVENRSKKFVLAKDLKDGQMGIVIKDCKHTGLILQGHYGLIVSVGMPYGSGFPSECSLEVRILEKGELIEIL